jgi:hypothetical protein
VTENNGTSHAFVTECLGSLFRGTLVVLNIPTIIGAWAPTGSSKACASRPYVLSDFRRAGLDFSDKRGWCHGLHSAPPFGGGTKCLL